MDKNNGQKHPRKPTAEFLLFGFCFFGTCFSCRYSALHDFQKSNHMRKLCRSCSGLPTYEGNLLLLKKRHYHLKNVAKSLFFKFPNSFWILKNYTRFLCVFFYFLVCELENHEKCVLDHNAHNFIFR
jgi:hypothetical protein